MKTGADHARNYRQRKAEKAAQTAQTLERYRGALEAILEMTAKRQLPLTSMVYDAAQEALTPTSHEMEGK